MNVKYTVTFEDGDHEVQGEVIGAAGMHLKTRRIGCPMTFDMVTERQAVDKNAFRNVLMVLSPISDLKFDGDTNRK